MKTVLNAMRKVSASLKNVLGMLRETDKKVILLILIAAVLYFILTPKWEVVVVGKINLSPAVYNMIPGSTPSTTYAPSVPPAIGGATYMDQPPMPMPGYSTMPVYAPAPIINSSGESGYVVVKVNKFSGAAYIWSEVDGWILLVKPRSRK